MLALPTTVFGSQFAEEYNVRNRQIRVPILSDGCAYGCRSRQDGGEYCNADKFLSPSTFETSDEAYWKTP